MSVYTVWKMKRGVLRLYVARNVGVIYNSTFHNKNRPKLPPSGSVKDHNI